ncbi:hypothetical protein X797_003231 [Metarhizium robertsii]|uniref:Uncharacterized protein n=1 Tax=Metarhizium robertsii TaxID=568076 RepID=A0A0A1V1D2_9HYPO|nr:hypothetical protein X797_003231 [Metarhizium robertsii]
MLGMDMRYDGREYGVGTDERTPESRKLGFAVEKQQSGVDGISQVDVTTKDGLSYRSLESPYKRMRRFDAYLYDTFETPLAMAVDPFIVYLTASSNRNMRQMGPGPPPNSHHAVI